MGEGMKETQRCDGAHLAEHSLEWNQVCVIPDPTDGRGTLLPDWDGQGQGDFSTELAHQGTSVGTVSHRSPCTQAEPRQPSPPCPGPSVVSVITGGGWGLGATLLLSAPLRGISLPSLSPWSLVSPQAQIPSWALEGGLWVGRLLPGAPPAPQGPKVTCPAAHWDDPMNRHQGCSQGARRRRELEGQVPTSGHIIFMGLDLSGGTGRPWGGGWAEEDLRPHGEDTAWPIPGAGGEREASGHTRVALGSESKSPERVPGNTGTSQTCLCCPSKLPLPSPGSITKPDPPGHSAALEPSVAP